MHYRTGGKLEIPTCMQIRVCQWIWPFSGEDMDLHSRRIMRRKQSLRNENKNINSSKASVIS